MMTYIMEAVRKFHFTLVGNLRFVIKYFVKKIYCAKETNEKLNTPHSESA
jgi:hypothetical protein